MIACNSIFFTIKGFEREFLVIPLMLQSKERPDLKSGKIEKLYFYENWRDEEYIANLEKENLPDKFRSKNYIINYGQDFGKYYWGSLNVDVDTKSFGVGKEHRIISGSKML